MCFWGASSGYGGPKQPLNFLMPWAGSGTDHCVLQSLSVSDTNLVYSPHALASVTVMSLGFISYL